MHDAREGKGGRIEALQQTYLREEIVRSKAHVHEGSQSRVPEETIEFHPVVHLGAIKVEARASPRAVEVRITYQPAMTRISEGGSRTWTCGQGIVQKMLHDSPRWLWLRLRLRFWRDIWTDSRCVLPAYG